MKQLPFLFILLIANYCTAQTWQWAVGGGSSNNDWVESHSEAIADIAVDPHGNIYTIATVDTESLNVGGIPYTGWFEGNNVLISSFTCSGVLRWAKVIGGTGSCFGIALRADNSDGIYIAASLGGSPIGVNIDIDTTLSTPGYRTVYLIKYDTIGNFQWVVSPEPDTVGFYPATETELYDLYVDGGGNISLLCQLPGGAYAGGTYIGAYGDHILQYDKNGIFQSGVKLDLVVAPYSSRSIRMHRSTVNGDFFLAGTTFDKIYLGTDSITRNMFIASFDASGNFLWKRQNTLFNYKTGIWGRPIVDLDNNIYVSGSSLLGDSFAGYTIVHGNGNVTPLIAKLDHAGNILWAHEAIVKTRSQNLGLALRNSGEVDAIGYSDDIKWPGFKDSMVSEHPQPILTRFNTQTGKILGMDSLPVQTSLWFGGIAAFPSAIATDGHNNLIIGGAFNDTIKAGNTIVKGTGGYNDFFVTKYGYNECNCDDIPEPKFTSINTSGNTFSFTYTGSTPFTNITWDFGDGNISTQTNPTHSFAKDGNYPVTVTVTNDCGDNTHGSNQVALKVGTTAKIDIRIYPNPAKDLVQIEGVNPVSVQLQNIQGPLIKRFSGDLKRLDVAGLPGGVYLLRIETANGISVHKLVKE
jgi:hypothetical protein